MCFCPKAQLVSSVSLRDPWKVSHSLNKRSITFGTAVFLSRRGLMRRTLFPVVVLVLELLFGAVVGLRLEMLATLKLRLW